MADTRYKDLHDYVRRSGRKKYAVAEDLQISRYQMSALLHPKRYGIDVTDELAARIAELLNQPASYVRKLYPKAA